MNHRPTPNPGVSGRQPSPSGGSLDESLCDGVLVVDLMAPEFAMTGRILADLGATVVRVRRHAHVDGVGEGCAVTRWDSRWRTGSDAFDRGVRLVDPGDPELVDLLERADVVLEFEGDPVRGAPPVPAGRRRVVVSPFGQLGPRSGWSASDLTVAAASGNLWATGDADRPPVRCAAPLSLVHAGPEVAFAALTSLAGGATAPVDVSLAETMNGACLGGPATATLTGARGQRAGAAIGPTREIWRCRDGWVSFGLRGGPARAPSLRRLATLAAERGDDRLAGVDWDAFRPASAPPDLLETLTDTIGRLFASLSVRDLERLSADEGVLVAPILDAPGVGRSAQLAARGFFTDDGGVAAPGLPRSFVAARTATSPWFYLAAPAAPGGDRATPPAATPTDTDAAGQPGAPWAGTTLVVLGSGVAGPLVGRCFSEQGATVVRVESTTRPDFLRLYAMGPDNPHGLEGSPLFTWTNAGSLGITLDLKTAGATHVLERLVAAADAVVENFTPDVLERLGLGFERLAAVNPSLVLLSTSFHGQTGPLRGASGFGALGSALTGCNHLTGWPDREPIGPASTITDSLTPRFAAAALAAALLHRRRTGRGIHLDVSQVEAALYALAPWLRWCGSTGREWGRDGNRSPDAVPHGVFRCTGDDRWVAAAVWDDEVWGRVLDLVGTKDPVLRGDPRARFAHVEQAESVLTGFTAPRSVEEAVAALRSVGVDAVGVADYCDVAADPTLAARGHFVHLAHQLLGDTVTERAGYRLTPDDGGYRRSAPTLGRDTDTVLSERLGLGAAELDDLRASGALR